MCTGSLHIGTEIGTEKEKKQKEKEKERNSMMNIEQNSSFYS